VIFYIVRNEYKETAVKKKGFNKSIFLMMELEKKRLLKDKMLQKLQNPSGCSNLR
jgi:hypothetical protein